ncbi:hypothetical protein GOODEAATRI_022595 [Goodea atripinnis]|uniref:Uncharacterized protein n=1 Tax=Goodea atripinnis TaxID=208336 RepID=A0ABV0PQU6_9TELE
MYCVSAASSVHADAVRTGRPLFLDPKHDYQNGLTPRTQRDVRDIGGAYSSVGNGAEPNKKRGRPLAWVRSRRIFRGRTVALNGGRVKVYLDAEQLSGL